MFSKTHAIFSYANNTNSLIFEVTIPSSENYFSPMFAKNFNQMIMNKNFSCSLYKITMWSCESLMIVIFTREISNSENFIDISILPFGQRSLNLAKKCNRRPLDIFWGLIKYHKKKLFSRRRNFNCISILKN